MKEEHIQLFSKPYEFTKSVNATLIAKVRCPFCQAAKKRLDWLQRILYPKFSFDVRNIGHIRTMMNVGTFYTIDESSIDKEITHIHNQIIKRFYPYATEVLPLTLIGNIDNFMHYNKTKPILINGCDRFEATISKKFSESARTVITPEEQKLIEKGEFDGLLFAENLYYTFIYPITGINDKVIVDTLKHQSDVANSIIKRMEEADIKNQ